MPQHFTIPGTLTIDLTNFDQNGVYQAIRTAYPTSPDYTVVSIAVPLIHINCIDFGIIDPVDALRNAANYIYDNCIRLIIQPIWDVLYGLYNVLKSFGLAFLDITIPILDLTIADLFNPNLQEIIRQKLLDLYNNAKDAFNTLISLLGIPDLRQSIDSPLLFIEYVVQAVMANLWNFLLKLIRTCIDLISAGLRLWEIATQEGAVIFSSVWDAAKAALYALVENLLFTIPTMQEIYNAIVAFARRFYNVAEVTAEMIMKIIQDFRFLGLKIFDWIFPWNPSVSMPEIDLMKVLATMQMWIKNYVCNIIFTFIKAVNAVLEFFGLSLSSLLSFSIPITFCAVSNNE